MYTLSIDEMVDVDVLKKMVTSLYEATGIAVGILDDKGILLVSAGWRSFCLKYHSSSSEAEKRCNSSFNYIVSNVWKGPLFYKCQNGLNEISVPVLVDGFHVATIIIGQFWFDDDNINENYFIQQANTFELDYAEYITAIRNLPVYTHEKINNIIEYYQNLVTILVKDSILELKFKKVKQQADKKQKGLRMLNSLYNKSSKTVELEYRLETVQRIIIETLNVDYVTIYKYDEVFNKLVMYSSTGLSDIFVNSFKYISPEDGLAGKTFAQRQRDLCLTKNIPNEKYIPYYINEGIKMAGCYPILFENSCLGVIGFGYKKVAVFTEEDHYFLDSICNFVAILLNNSILLNQLKKDLEERKDIEKSITRINNDVESAREEAKRVRSVFRYNLSHELRTPMNGIFGMIQLLEMEEISEEQRKIVNILKESAQRMICLINNITDMIMIETGQVYKQEKVFDINLIIDEIIDFFSERIKEKNISFSHFIEDNVPKYVIGDKEKIATILKQIVDNAIKFTNHGHVDITAKAFNFDEEDKFNLCFSIKDTGIGLDMSSKSELFKPFKQGDESYTRQHDGVGLGLAISNDLANTLNGKIDVNSEIDKGSTFTVTLPVKRASDKIDMTYSFYQNELKAFIF